MLCIDKTFGSYFKLVVCNFCSRGKIYKNLFLLTKRVKKSFREPRNSKRKLIKSENEMKKPPISTKV